MTETIAVELEVESDTLVKSLLDVLEHKHPEIKGSKIRGRLDE